MREIKVRAKTLYAKDEQFWVYGLLVREVGGGWSIQTEDCKLIGVDPETVEQCVGQKDKHGKEIYEGNILHTNEADWIAKVIWHYDGFMLTGLNNTGFSCSPDYDKCEIIGDIHE